jgi:predicted nucleotidyltransferase
MLNNEILTIKDVIVNSVECERVYLFGSYAYGAPTDDSDYDFYVVLKNDSVLKPLDAMDVIEMNLSRTNVRKSADVTANYKNRFEYRSTQPTIERTVATEGVLLYERH